MLSLIVMPGLAWVEFRTGRELGSRSVRADAKQLLLCVYLSGTVLVGLLIVCAQTPPADTAHVKRG